MEFKMAFNYSNANDTNQKLFPRQATGNQNSSVQATKHSLEFTYNSTPTRPNFWGNSSFQFAFIQLLVKLILQLITQQLKPQPITPDPGDIRPVYGVPVEPNPGDIRPVYGVPVDPEPGMHAVYGVPINPESD